MLWLPRPEYNAGMKAYGSFMGTVGHFVAGELSKNAYIDLAWKATPADSPQPFPICIFSHGYLSGRYGYQSICSGLAANGYVVFALEHRCDIF